jgi:hypothetical protein
MGAHLRPTCHLALPCKLRHTCTVCAIQGREGAWISHPSFEIRRTYIQCASHREGCHAVHHVQGFFPASFVELAGDTDTAVSLRLVLTNYFGYNYARCV